VPQGGDYAENQPYDESEDHGLNSYERGNRKALQDQLRHRSALEVVRVAQVPPCYVGYILDVLDVQRLVETVFLEHLLTNLGR
jgi:hypothetical protein